MAISVASLKWYKCLNWADAATHGGGIDTGTQIISETKNNIFSDVGNTERITGTTNYRKIYFRNENSDTYGYPKAWIYSNTESTGDTIYVRLGGTKGLTGNATALTGTATFTNGATIIYTSNDLTAEVNKGEYIFNSSDDTTTQSASIDTIFATKIWLSGNYVGTTGDDKSISVASIGFASVTWYQPASKGSTTSLSFSSMAQNTYQAIWIKRIVDVEASGFASNNFVLACENATS